MAYIVIIQPLGSRNSTDVPEIAQQQLIRSSVPIEPAGMSGKPNSRMMASGASVVSASGAAVRVRAY